MIASDNDLQQWDQHLQNQSPRDILKAVLARHHQVAISFSGAEDVVLVDLAVKLRAEVTVFTLDTGRLHPETYAFLDRVRTHYGLSIVTCFPEAEAVQQLVSTKGFFSFYQDNHHECCGIRKIAPLRRQLAHVDAWITGQRKDQSPGTRQGIPIVQQDLTFAAPGKTLFKYNPLANWSSADVWAYIRALEVPYNPLHDRGFISIGCEPCTKPVGPNQHEREGRWWWEEATHKECGLHAENLG